MNGKRLRRSLNTHSWENAEDIKREMEAGSRPATDEPPITIDEALARFLADCKARNLNPSTFTKYRHLEKALSGFAAQNRFRLLRELDARNMRDFRNSWTLGPLTSSKELERLRAFFRYCVDSDLIEKNPAKGIRPPVVRFHSREPFTSSEQAKLLAWCNHPHWQAAEGRNEFCRRMRKLRSS